MAGLDIAALQVEPSISRIFGSNHAARPQDVGQRETMALPKLRRRLVIQPSAETVLASASIGPWKRKIAVSTADRYRAVWSA